MIDRPTLGKETDTGASVAAMPQSELSPAHRRRVQHAAARFEADQRNARERFRLALAGIMAEGGAAAAIARELGVSRQAVHNRLRRGQGSDRPSRSKVTK